MDEKEKELQQFDGWSQVFNPQQAPAAWPSTAAGSAATARATNGAPNDAMASAPNGATVFAPNGTTSGATVFVANGTTNGTTNGVTNGTPSGATPAPAPKADPPKSSKAEDLDEKAKRRAKLHRDLFEILDSARVDSPVERGLNIFLLVMILLNTVAVIIEPSYREGTMAVVLRGFDIFSVIVFTIEYITRVWVSDLYYPKRKPALARLRYMVTSMALIDLLAILPFYLPFIFSVDLRVLRTLRLFRIFRIFKANRYVKSLHLVTDVFKRKSSELISSLSIVVILLLISSVLVFSFEHAVQPQYFRNFMDALWWSIATVTTIGYGDIYPVTGMGRAIASFIAFLGVGIIAIPTGIIASGFTEIVQENRIKENLEETRRLILSCAQPQSRDSSSESSGSGNTPHIVMLGEEGYDLALASRDKERQSKSSDKSSSGSKRSSSKRCPHCGRELE